MPRDSGERLLGLLAAALGGDPRLGEKNVVVARVSRCPQRRDPALPEQETLHPVAVIGGCQRVREGLQKP
jgi:hypothetical protein